jgi:hypothetical protein
VVAIRSSALAAGMSMLRRATNPGETSGKVLLLVLFKAKSIVPQQDHAVNDNARAHVYWLLMHLNMSLPCARSAASQGRWRTPQTRGA